MTRPCTRKLIDSNELAGLDIVANASMNRDRGIAGVNSYARELGFDPLDFLQGGRRRWLDLCCGSGRALVEAAARLPDVAIEGLDLMDMFVPHPGLGLSTGSVEAWSPLARYDLITCVHGLHYVADKLRLLCVAAGSLSPDGRLAANLDLDNVVVPGGRRRLRSALSHAGFQYDARRHVVSFCGRSGEQPVSLPFEFVGADPSAGPNYTKQPAVTSVYRSR